MTDNTVGAKISGRRKTSTARAVETSAAALAMIAASTLIGQWAAPHSGSELVVMIYLVAVLASAALWGVGRGLVATIAAVLAYDFFFTEPVHTFRMDRMADVATAVVLLVAAIATSQLAATIGNQARTAANLTARNATIAKFAGRLLSCSMERDIAWATCAELHRLFDCNVLAMAGFPEPQLVASIPGGMQLTPSDIAAAALTIYSGETAGRGTPRLQAAEWLFYPVRSGDDILATVGLARDDGSPPVDEAELTLIAELLDNVALALVSHRRQRGRPESVAFA